MAGTRSQKTTQKGSDEPPQKRKASDESTISDRTEDNVKYEKLRAKLAKVQAENGELKAFSSQVRGAKSAKALAKATMNTGVQTEILQQIRTVVWRTTHFVANANQENTVSGWIHDLIYGEGKNEGKKLQWIDTYAGFIMEQINKHRTYVLQRLSGPAVDWLATHEKLPTEQQMEMLLLRGFDPKDPKNEDIMEIFMWYWDEFLPKVPGFGGIFKDSQRRYATISKCAPKNDPEAPYITPQMEAFAVVAFLNCKEKWIQYKKIKAEHPNKTIVPCTYVKGTKNEGPVGEYVVDGKHLRVYGEAGEYTSATGGQKRYGGWSVKGLKKYKQLKKMAKQGRKSKLCAAIEKQSLEELRESLGLVAATHAQEIKNRKPKKANGEDEEEEFDTWSTDAEDGDGDNTGEAAAKPAGKLKKGDDDSGSETENES
jgi:hypothetical protein